MDQPLRTIAGLVDGVAVDVEVYPDRLEWRQWAAGRRLLDPLRSGAASRAPGRGVAGDVDVTTGTNLRSWPPARPAVAPQRSERMGLPRPLAAHADRRGSAPLRTVRRAASSTRPGTPGPALGASPFRPCG